MIEDNMVGWHHRLSRHGFEQTPGDGKGQESLMCCSPWGCKETDMTQQMNNNKVYYIISKKFYLNITDVVSNNFITLTQEKMEVLLILMYSCETNRLNSNS